MNRLKTYFAVAPSLALVTSFVLIPAILLVRVSLYEPASGRGFFLPGTFTLDNYRHLSDSHTMRIMGFTAGFGTLVAFVAVAVAFSLAVFLRSLPSRWQKIALILILIPKTSGLLATLFGLQRWLPRGVIAAVISEVYLIIPYAVLVLYAQLRSIDSRLFDAASGLGANGWQVFRTVTLPLSRYGLLVAFQLSFIWGLSAFLGPLFLGGPEETTLSVELHRQAFEYGRWPRAAAEAVALLMILGIAIFVGNLPWRSKSKE